MRNFHLFKGVELIDIKTIVNCFVLWTIISLIYGFIRLKENLHLWWSFLLSLISCLILNAFLKLLKSFSDYFLLLLNFGQIFYLRTVSLLAFICICYWFWFLIFILILFPKIFIIIYKRISFFFLSSSLIFLIEFVNVFYECAQIFQFFLVFS